MKVTPRNVSVKEIFDGFDDKGDDGVFALGGSLSIRPPYQREFVYSPSQSESVVHTVLKGFPLGSMYWVLTGDGGYEVLDGQQRTLSLMKFMSNEFPVRINGSMFYWDSLDAHFREAVSDYRLQVFVCDGEDWEKLEWFRVVNIAGERLTEQELYNSVYTGPWLSDAKRRFSKSKCDAWKEGKDYVSGVPNRQELLEKTLKGISEARGMDGVTNYMAQHRSDKDANDLWQYYYDVVSWAKKLFSQVYLPDMRGLDWFHLYNRYGTNRYNTFDIANRVESLRADEEVQKKRGVYEYVLSSMCESPDPYAARLLNLRSFTERDRHAAYARQDGVCPVCGKRFEYSEMEGDHIVPWSKGGATTADNCQMLCRKCNSLKSDKY